MIIATDFKYFQSLSLIGQFLLWVPAAAAAAAG